MIHQRLDTPTHGIRLPEPGAKHTCKAPTFSMALDNKAVLDAKRSRCRFAMTVFVFLLVAIDDELPGFSGLDGDVRAAERTLVVAGGSVGVGEVETGVVLEVFGVDAKQSCAVS